jgi:hypothetical protein
MKYLWAFHKNCGRMGSVDGRFRATSEEVQKAFGKEVYLGEVLGKHSEVMADLNDTTITLVTDNSEFLAIADDLKIDLSSGINPLEYIE